MTDKKEEGDNIPLPPSIIDDIKSEKRAHLARNIPRRLEDWHQFLASKHCKEHPVLHALEEDWQRIGSASERGKELTDIAGDTSLMETLRYYIDFGMYPPPEVLLTILDLWEIYVAYKGSITLEEIFITGSSKPKAGNPIIQEDNQEADMRLFSRYDSYIDGGCTQIEAARKIKSEFHMKAEEESIVRMMRQKEKEEGNPYLDLYKYTRGLKRQRD